MTRAIGDWAGADEGAVGRTIAYSLATITAVVVFLVGIPLSNLRQHVPSDQVAWTVLYLVPQALVVAIPLGLMFGVLSGLRGRVATRRVRRSITALAIVCSIATFVLVAWTVPAAKQAFRELMVAIDSRAASTG